MKLEKNTQYYIWGEIHFNFLVQNREVLMFTKRGRALK